jgi:hypothetical protein
LWVILCLRSRVAVAALLRTGVASSAYLYVTFRRHASPAAVRVPLLRNPTAAQVQIVLSTYVRVICLLSVHLPLNSLQLSIQ